MFLRGRPSEVGLDAISELAWRRGIAHLSFFFSLEGVRAILRLGSFMMDGEFWKIKFNLCERFIRILRVWLMKNKF